MTTTINAPSLLDVVYSGAAPFAAAHGYATLAANQVGDKIRLNKLYAGTKVYEAKAIVAALGANTTISLGYEACDGSASSPTAFINAAASASAGKLSSAVAPITIPYDAYVIATVGGAVANGQIDTVVQFEFQGE